MLSAVEAGTALDPISRGPISRTQIAKFCGATGDFNPIHTDDEFARKIGLPSLIAPGPMTLAFLNQALAHNFGPENVRAVAGNFRAPVLPGDALRIEGTVTEVAGGRATVELKVLRGPEGDAAEVVATGSGMAEL